MKKLFDILLITFVLTISSCTDKSYPYKDLILPDKIEYSKIILEILKQDTVFINQGLLQSEYVGNDLSNLKINFHRPKPDTTGEVDIVPFPDFKTSLLELYYYHVTDSINRQIDSLFFAFQNDSLKPVLVDSNIVNIARLATSEVKTKYKGKQNFGFFQFSIPILNKAKTKAYVQTDFVCSGLCGQGMTYILEKINNKWTLQLAKTRWVS